MLPKDVNIIFKANVPSLFAYTIRRIITKLHKATITVGKAAPKSGGIPKSVTK